MLPAHLKTAPGVADGNEEPYFNVHAQLTGLLVTSAPAPHPRMPICLQADDERPSRPRPKRHRAATDANCGRQARGRCTGWPAWLVWAAQRFGHPQMHKPHSAQNYVESPQGAAGGPHGFHNVTHARAAHLAYGPGCWRGAWGWLGAVTWLGGWLRSTSVTSRNPTRGAELCAEQVVASQY